MRFIEFSLETFCMDQKTLPRCILKPLTTSVGKSLALVMLLCAGAPSVVYAAENTATANLTAPPYIARTSAAMMTLFHFKADDVQKLLPDGVTVKSDANGQVIGGIEMYTTDQAYGVANYTLAFFFVQVRGVENNAAEDGNWVVWGKVDNNSALQGFTGFYNYPYVIDKDVSVKRDGSEALAVFDKDGQEGFKLELKIKTDKPFAGEGLANSYSQLPDGKIIKSEIPWLATGNEAEVVSFTVNAGDNSVLKTLQQGKAFYAGVSNNAFSYSAPVPVTK
ncbi:hypothetical protein C4F51_11795 [Cellvibrio sp. KB43]|uniref:Uncharacterized protein n=2 Tax=Cellvibrio polysaccharolyticus TaxID=2082724 RepID=A0A928YTS3_9GAMM|nr:hypothetical protein [Cellvibrio polysaccharolyticus]